MLPTYQTLRARYLEDIRPFGPGATPALSAALDSIGWRAVQEPSPEELADHLMHLLDACVHEHYDVTALVHRIAVALRETGPLMDGGLLPVEAYLPAATEVIEHYVRDNSQTPRN